MVKAYAMMGSLGGLLFTIGIGAHDMHDYVKQTTLLLVGAALGGLSVHFMMQENSRARRNG